MTNANTVTLKAVAAILEASDLDDAADAKQAMALVRALLGADEKKS